jgi:hypothetical protein
MMQTLPDDTAIEHRGDDHRERWGTNDGMEAPYTHLRVSEAELRLHALHELSAARRRSRRTGGRRLLRRPIGRLLIALGTALRGQEAASFNPMGGGADLP